MSGVCVRARCVFACQVCVVCVQCLYWGSGVCSACQVSLCPVGSADRGVQAVGAPARHEDGVAVATEEALLVEEAVGLIGLQNQRAAKRCMPAHARLH